MDLTRPFLGSTAVAAGIVTPKQLRGPRFRSPVRGVFVAAETPDTFLTRCEAVALAVGALRDVASGSCDTGLASAAAPGAAEGGPRADPCRAGTGGSATVGADAGTALAGWAAADTLGADCAPPNAAVDVLVAAGHRRPTPGVRVHHRLVLPGEIVTGVRIPAPGEQPPYVIGRTATTTSALRTAFDLTCSVGRIDAVIALDALSRVGGFDPADVLGLAAHHRGTRGVGRLPGLVRLATPLAESPMETRIRLALHDHGLPAPVLQYPVGDFRIDLAFPAVKLGIEYDGHHHLDPVRARKDLERQAFLTAQGWEIFRPEAWMVLRRPDLVAATVWSHLTSRRPR